MFTVLAHQALFVGKYDEAIVDPVMCFINKSVKKLTVLVLVFAIATSLCYQSYMSYQLYYFQVQDREVTIMTVFEGAEKFNQTVTSAEHVK